ncbi:hypothetical protein M1L60_37875 [Actinoplanes sp. TRM 88003]|uniref:DUF4367 domain-containing protein n=1 Tax=Paractinoplanes aksuensis TaxID=2939490 RepID=A0ABT1DZQ6_9ACTN|nr:hypothetical protein [Actinoplanes aksuensis]MCO8276365.1 hypothetical protein [Actinoplanes aksuensis]
MTRHPNDGVLRRLVDEPLGVADTDREHVANCPICTEGVAMAQKDALFTAEALPAEADVDVDAAWRRLAAADPGRAPSRTRRKWRSPIIAGAAVGVLLAGAGAAAAGDWFQIFRTERIAPVTVHQADLMAMPDLSSWGDVEITSRPQIHPVGDAAAAEKESGLDLPEVAELPRGVTGEPSYQAGKRISASFTFRAAKVAAFAQKQGETPPTMPAGLDGSSFRLTAGPGAATVWSSKQGVPSMIVARAVAPTAYSTGVPFVTARDYLLSLSGLPADVAAQLRRFTADGTTLPLHVMPEEMTSEPTDVGGAPATLLSSSDGVMSAVVWVRAGTVTLVAGSLSGDEVLTVARGLR